MASRTHADRPATWRRLLLALLLVAAPTGAAGAERGPYRIGPGDVLDVRVWREPDLSGRHRVGVDGSVQHVLAGGVVAEGSTVDELAARLRERLEHDFLREARVAVTLVESSRRRASVLGSVESPGAYPVGSEARVLDLIAAAGGLSTAASGEATLLRFDDAPEQGAARSEAEARERIEIDLNRLLAGADLSANHPVGIGDVLVVRGSDVASPPPAGGGRIRVVGQVGRPGNFPLSEAPTLLDAVLAAGGLGEYAAANRARLVRETDGAREELRVRLGDLLEGSSEEPNRSLRDGDLIVVPESFF